MNRTNVATLLIAFGLFSTVGCATKGYVRNQVTPINNKIGELNDITAKNTQDIKDVNGKAQQGIDAASAADQRAGAAATSADQANQKATTVATGLNGLQGTVENLDNFKPVANTAVQFRTSSSTLTKADEQMLDEFAQQIGQQKHYIVQVEGHTDDTGPALYNAELSRRRADAVILYLASKHNIPTFRIYTIGLGEHSPVAENNTAGGRAKNRRVDVQLLTNSLESASAQSKPPAQPQGPTDQQ
jgi:outer membrane protein OmpA-like peptidoglycan-associated protein